jgi:hypothetical protein
VQLQGGTWYRNGCLLPTLKSKQTLPSIFMNKMIEKVVLSPHTLCFDAVALQSTLVLLLTTDKVLEKIDLPSLYKQAVQLQIYKKQTKPYQNNRENSFNLLAQASRANTRFTKSVPTQCNFILMILFNIIN